MARLDALRLPYAIPEDNDGGNSVARKCRTGHERMKGLCDTLDEILLADHADLAADGCRPFLFHIFTLNFLADAVRSRLRYLQLAFQHFRPQQVRLHVGPTYPWGPLLGFDNRELLWGRIASAVANQLGIAVTARPSSAESWSRMDDSALSWRKRKALGAVRNWLGRSPRLLAGLSFLHGRGQFRTARSSEGTGRHTLVQAGRFEWDSVAAVLRAKGWRVVRTYVPTDGIRGPIALGRSHVSEIISRDPALGSIFEEAGISFLPFIEDRLNWIWSVFPDRYRQIRRAMNRASMRRLGPATITTAACASGSAHAFNTAARTAGFKVATWQHGFVGTGARVPQNQDFNDLMTADLCFVYGPVVKDAYERAAQVPVPDIVVAGSARLAALRQRFQAIPGRGKAHAQKVVYVTTSYSQNYWYLRTEAGGLSDRLFYRDQARIAEALVEWVRWDPGQRTAVLKLDSQREYLSPPWADLLRGVPGIQIVERERRFVDLLCEADAVVIDSPTTTLLEALTTDLPIFVLTRHWSYPRDLWQVLGRRAVCAADAQTLTGAIGDWLNGSRYPADVKDTRFLEEFGVQEDVDGVVAIIHRSLHEITVGRTAGSTDSYPPPVAP